MDDDHSTQAAERLLLNSLTVLGSTYRDSVFYVERDIVYTTQRLIQRAIDLEAGWLRVYNDYPMIRGPRRGLSADLVLLTPNDQVAVAVEFKYEPCHRRHDVLRNKLPVTSWAEIVKDTVRVRDFVEQGVATVGYAIVIDEGRYLHHRDLTIYAERQRWDGHPRHDHSIDALIHRYPSRS